MTSADHGDSRLRENIHVAADVEHQRWIVDLAELGWICGIIEREDMHSGSLGLAHLLLRQFHGLARAQRLRRYGKQAGGFEFGEGSTENRRHVAKMLNQTTGASRAKTRGESQCEPLQGLLRDGPIQCGSRCRHKSLHVPIYAPGKNPVQGATHLALLESNIVNMSRLRISAISFLNTAPLMWDFEHGAAGAQFDISYTVPSACAGQLAAGTADIGIVPVAAYAQISDLAIIPGVAIAARRSVRSILLVSKVPVAKIETIALDTSSMTSVALTKVLFERWLGAGRRFTDVAPNLEIMLRDHDAGLVIGDTALQVDRSKCLTLDLAEEWIRFTGKPFVFAFWAIRRAALANAPADLASMFQTSRDHGVQPQNINSLARDWAGRVGLSADEVRTYLTGNIHYHLDPGCLEGLQLFYRYAAECGALPPAPALQFVEVAKFATT